MEDFLKEIGIVEQPTEKEGSWVIDIPDSNEYARYYSKFDKSDLVEEDEESSQITLHSSSVQFLSDDYTFTLLADFDGDVYSLVIREN